MMLIEDCIDDLPQDVDVDGANGQLTLTFEDGSQIVISRQPVQQEIYQHLVLKLVYRLQKFYL